MARRNLLDRIMGFLGGSDVSENKIKLKDINMPDSVKALYDDIFRYIFDYTEGEKNQGFDDYMNLLESNSSNEEINTIHSYVESQFDSFSYGGEFIRRLKKLNDILDSEHKIKTAADLFDFYKEGKHPIEITDEKSETAISPVSSEPAKTDTTPASSETTKGATPPTSSEPAKTATPSDSGETTKGATPPTSSEPAKTATPSDSGETTKGATPPTSSEPAKTATPSDSGESTKGATPPTSSKPIKGATPPASSEPAKTATPPTSSESTKGATPPASSKPAKGATPPASSKPAKGATAPAGSKPIKGATPPTSGESAKGATAPAGSKPIKGATPPTSGESAKGATPPASGESTKGATPPTSSESTKSDTPKASETVVSDKSFVKLDDLNMSLNIKFAYDNVFKYVWGKVGLEENYDGYMAKRGDTKKFEHIFKKLLKSKDKGLRDLLDKLSTYDPGLIVDNLNDLLNYVKKYNKRKIGFSLEMRTQLVEARINLLNDELNNFDRSGYSLSEKQDRFGLIGKYLYDLDAMIDELEKSKVNVNSYRKEVIKLKQKYKEKISSVKEPKENEFLVNEQLFDQTIIEYYRKLKKYSELSGSDAAHIVSVLRDMIDCLKQYRENNNKLKHSIPHIKPLKLASSKRDEIKEKNSNLKNRIVLLKKDINLLEEKISIITPKIDSLPTPAVDSEIGKSK